MALIEQVSKLGKADLHIHTNFSDGKNSVEEVLSYTQDYTDLDVIAITDHNTIDGALEARKIALKNNYRFEVIVGEEISTMHGHIIGLFLDSKVESGMSVEKTLKSIKKQGGLTIAPHPFFHTRMKTNNGLLMDGIGVVRLIREKSSIDGVEGINATPSLAQENIRAQFVNNALIFKAEIGSSDAHIKDIIGKGRTLFEGKSAEELRAAIENGQTKAVSERKNFSAILKYGFFFLPKGTRMFFYTLFHGRTAKRPRIIGIDKKSFHNIKDDR